MDLFSKLYPLNADIISDPGLMHLRKRSQGAFTYSRLQYTTSTTSTSTTGTNHTNYTNYTLLPCTPYWLDQAKTWNSLCSEPCNRLGHFNATCTGQNALD